MADGYRLTAGRASECSHASCGGGAVEVAMLHRPPPHAAHGERRSRWPCAALRATPGRARSPRLVTACRKRLQKHRYKNYHIRKQPSPHALYAMQRQPCSAPPLSQRRLNIHSNVQHSLFAKTFNAEAWSIFKICKSASPQSQRQYRCSMPLTCPLFAIPSPLLRTAALVTAENSVNSFVQCVPIFSFSHSWLWRHVHSIPTRTKDINMLIRAGKSK